MNIGLRIIVFTFVGLVVVGSLATAGYFYRQYRLIVNNTQRAEEIQNQQILSTIKKVMDLPTEKPSIVTITDREKLQDQVFFQKAQNGDKIIVYEAARRIILYRPSTARIIDVAPLVYNNSPTNQSNAASVVQTENLLPSPPIENTPGASPSAETKSNSSSEQFSPQVAP